MKDDLGNRIKENYENRTRVFLPRRTHTIIRLDGKAFHSFTKHCKKPFDEFLMSAMDETAKVLCEQIQGCKFAYVQSDEISLLLTDFDDIKTQAWFDGNIQKVVSISASIATARFNQIYNSLTLAYFDSRVFTISDPEEVINYFIWRQQDATRNSIQMSAQALYSHKELNGKNTSELQDMMFQKGVNWNNQPDGFKRGRFIYKESFEFKNDKNNEVCIRHRWIINKNPPIFTQNKEFLTSKFTFEQE